MRHPLLIRLMLLVSCGMLATSCEKEADTVAPTPLAATLVSNALTPGNLAPVPLGGWWLQGPAVTGMPEGVMINMQLVKHVVSNAGEIDTWQGTVPEQYRPAVKTTFKTYFTYVHRDDGEEYLYQIFTVTEPSGVISMRTNWNVKTNRQDDI